MSITFWAATASAQDYTAVILPPPSDVPNNSFAYTDAYALNKKGQVFGRAGNTNPPTPRRPVLWTNGSAPQNLPVPQNYHWFDASRWWAYNFINNAGIVVSTVQDNRSNDTSAVRPVVWRSGTATILPLPSPGCIGFISEPLPPEWTLSSWPLGLNAAGHILIEACNNFFIWDGSTFRLLAQPEPVTGCLGLANFANEAVGGNRLNNADHVSLDRRWFIDQGCPLPLVQPGIFVAPNTFVPAPTQSGSSGQINNLDQMLLAGGPRLNLWNRSGDQLIEIGATSGGSLNNLGEVAFRSSSIPYVYKNGQATQITLPPEAAGTQDFLLNDNGQIAGTKKGLEYRAVILTPVPRLKSLTVPAVVTGCKTVAGTVVLEDPAPPGGVTVSLSTTTTGASVPASLTFKAGVSQKTFEVTTTAVAGRELGEVRASIGGDSVSTPLALRPIGVQSLVLTPNPVTGGQQATGTVTLECNAGPGEISVALSSTDPAVAQPTVASINVAVGTKIGTFTIATFPTNVVKKPTIGATVPDARSKSKVLTVRP